MQGEQRQIKGVPIGFGELPGEQVAEQSGRASTRGNLLGREHVGFLVSPHIVELARRKVREESHEQAGRHPQRQPRQAPVFFTRPGSQPGIATRLAPAEQAPAGPHPPPEGDGNAGRHQHHPGPEKTAPPDCQGDRLAHQPTARLQLDGNPPRRDREPRGDKQDETQHPRRHNRREYQSPSEKRNAA